MHGLSISDDGNRGYMVSTGSLNAGLALWLQESGLAGDRYVAAQGAALGRAGRVHVVRDAEATWIGGDVSPLIHGQVRL